MNKEYDLYFYIEETEKYGFGPLIAYGYFNTKTKIVSNRHFGPIIRSQELHSEAENILIAAVKNFKVSTSPVNMCIKKSDWEEYLLTKDITIIEKCSYQKYKSMDVYELKEGPYNNHEITNIQHYVRTLDNNIEKISDSLAKTLDLIELEKLSKVKTNEIDINKLMKHIQAGHCLVIVTDIYFKLKDSSTIACLPYLDFVRLAEK